MTILFPSYAPTSWELTLPGWPVITNSWRSSEFPEILGSLPEGAQLSLRYENVTDAEALELLLLWRATAGGVHALDPLPAQVAAGITDASLADRILDVAPMAWTVAVEPRQESVKAGRSTVEIELRTELRVEPSTPLPVVSCPAWSPRVLVGCAGGAGGVGPPSVKPLPPLIGPPAPPAPAEGIFWALDHAGTLSSYYGTVDNNGAYHNTINNTSGDGSTGLAYFYCYDWSDITSPDTRFYLQFVDTDGFSRSGRTDARSFAIGSSVYHFFNTYDGVGVSRIYLVEIVPATGAVVRYATYECSTTSSDSGQLWSINYSEADNSIYLTLRARAPGISDQYCKISMSNLSVVWWKKPSTGGIYYGALSNNYFFVLRNDTGAGNNEMLFVIDRSTGAVAEGPYVYEYEDPANPGVWVKFEPWPGESFVADSEGNLYSCWAANALVLKINGSTLQPEWLVRHTNFLADMADFGITNGTAPMVYNEATDALILIRDGGSNSSSGRRSFRFELDKSDGTLLDCLDPGTDESYSPQPTGVFVAESRGNSIFIHNKGNGKLAYRYPAKLTATEGTEVQSYPLPGSLFTVGPRAVGTTEYLSRDDGWNLRRSTVSTTTVMNDAADYTKSTNSGNLTTQAATINWPNPPGIGRRWYLGGL